MRYVGVLICLLAVVAVSVAAPISKIEDAATNAVLATGCKVVRIIATEHVKPVVAVYQDRHDYYEHRIGYAPDLTEIVKDLIADNKAMRADLIQAIRTGGSGGPLVAPLKAMSPGEQVMATDCARCHNATTKKGGFAAFDAAGKFIGTDEQRGAAIKAIKEGRMPKDRKWSFEQKYEAQYSLTTVEDEAPKVEALKK